MGERKEAHVCSCAHRHMYGSLHSQAHTVRDTRTHAAHRSLFSMHPCVGQGVECVLTQGHAPCTCLSHTEVHAHANENVDVHSPKEASFVLGVEESKMKRT